MIVKLAKSLGGGAATYEDGKRKLAAAIKVYDQALVDLAVHLLASTTASKFWLILGNKIQQDAGEKEKRDSEFLQMAVTVTLACRGSIPFPVQSKGR